MIVLPSDDPSIETWLYYC